MYAGHAAMGIAMAAVAPQRGRAAVALLVGASIAADVGWCVLTMASIEGGHSLGSQALHAPRLPWSHSLLSTTALAIAFTGIAFSRGGVRLAALSAAAVALHWLVGDVPFGEAFPVTPWSEPVATPHLYAQWPVAFAIESATVAGCVLLAARMLGGRRAAILFGVLLALHVASWLPTFAAQPPIDLQLEPMRIVAYLVLLLASWAACVAVTPRSA